jgi:hypothetical protein
MSDRIQLEWSGSRYISLAPGVRWLMRSLVFCFAFSYIID